MNFLSTESTHLIKLVSTTSVSFNFKSLSSLITTDMHDEEHRVVAKADLSLYIYIYIYSHTGIVGDLSLKKTALNMF